MKLSSFDRAKVLVDERTALLHQVDLVTRSCDKNRILGVTIQGYYQDAGMLDVLRPVIITELRRRLEPLEVELTAIGLELK